MRKPKEIPSGIRTSIKHAYSEAITRAARLAAFAYCPLLLDWGEVETRQELLAADDLIAFAIHVRRIVEITGLRQPLNAVVVNAFVDGAWKDIPVMHVINSVIHHKKLSVWRRKSDAMPLPKLSDTDEFVKWMEAGRQGIRPLVTLQTDRVVLMGVLLDAFMKVAVTGIIAEIIEHCDDRGLYLEDLDGN